VIARFTRDTLTNLNERNNDHGKIICPAFFSRCKRFHFGTIREYKEKIFRLWVAPAVDVGDLNIRFIDGEAIDREVLEALEVNKDNIADYLRIVKGAFSRES
jgi:hypothetical protein